MNLRPYQREALEISRTKFAAGVTRQLIALPTGTGKTPLFACVRDHFKFSNQIMVLVHREELAQQAADKLRTWNPGCSVGVEMADSIASPMDDFIVASVPTIGRTNSTRIQKFKPGNFDAIITDEAHHSTAQTYRNIFNHFGLHEPENKRLLLGVTATVSRGDGNGLADVYDEIIYQMSILDAIKDGWLVDLRGYRIHTHTSLDKVHTQAGDFAQGELAREVNTPERNDLIVKEWLEKAHDRKTVVFTVDIKHAKDLAEVFGRYNVPSAAIWGDDPDRKDKLRRHREGLLRVLCNCGILTEGYDDPAIGCIVLARPTKSGLLYAQMVGRGTRLDEGKKDCLIMDITDNSTRHSLSSLSSLFGLGPDVDMKGETVTKKMADEAELERKRMEAEAERQANQLVEAQKLAAYAEKIDLFKSHKPDVLRTMSQFRWMQSSNKESYVLLLPNRESMIITIDMIGNLHIIGSVNGNKIHTQAGHDLPKAFQQAESFVCIHGKNLIEQLRDRKNGISRSTSQQELGTALATRNQIDLLTRLRIPFKINMTKLEAEQKVREYFESRKPQPVAVRS